MVQKKFFSAATGDLLHYLKNFNHEHLVRVPLEEGGKTDNPVSLSWQHFIREEFHVNWFNVPNVSIDSMDLRPALDIEI